MRRLKILVGAILIISTFFILTVIHGFQANVTSETEDSAIGQEQHPMELENQLQYELRRKELKAAVKAYFEKAFGAEDMVGAGVSIVKGDSILLSEGYGKKNINYKDKVDGQTVFRLGSLSKGFTGVLATELENEGKLKWEDKVSDYIPEFQLGDKNNTDKITLAKILSHTSGTPYHSFTNLVDAGVSLDVIAKKFREVTPISEPGSMYSYQNAMFALSASMMQKATGQDISTLFQNRFFRPLGMTTAITDYETLLKSQDIAVPHTKNGNVWKSVKLSNSYHNAIAAGGINASALDMGKWMRFLLGHNPEVMNKTVIAEAFEPRIEIDLGRKYYKSWPGHTTSSYGFGWRIHKFIAEGTKEEKTIWHHGGSVNHFRNEIAMYPEDDLGICVLMNSSSQMIKTVIPDLYKIIGEIYDSSSHQVPSSARETVSLTFE